jgi:hypothetical protein
MCADVLSLLHAQAFTSHPGKLECVLVLGDFIDGTFNEVHPSGSAMRVEVLMMHGILPLITAQLC